MFEKARIKPSMQHRQIIIELRDGRTLKGRLLLPSLMSAEGLLARATPFLTIRTPDGDVAMHRDLIAALLLADDDGNSIDQTGGVFRSRRKSAPSKLRPASLGGGSVGRQPRGSEAQAKPGTPGGKVLPFVPTKGTSDPRKVLRVQPGASRDELRAAWRRRIGECHPDKIRNRGFGEDAVIVAQREAQLVNAAYQELTSVTGGAARRR